MSEYPCNSAEDPGLSHYNLIVVAVLPFTSSTKLIGGSGCVIIKAPVPTFDSSESPYPFVAYTFANTSSPKLIEYGRTVSLESGIEHCVLAMIVESVPSQSESSYE